jgi:Ty3 transposon capsid-like protein
MILWNNTLILDTPTLDTLTTTIQGETMADTIVTTGASDKIKLNPPTPFTGKQNKFVLFMQDIYVYLKVNWNTYDNDSKKISFILSYLTGGDAAIWKQQFIQMKIEEQKTKEPDWKKYKDFIEALKRTFQPYDKLAEALEDMKKLRLSDNSITEHNSRFRLLVSKTGMKDSLALTDLYRETLPWALQSPIIRSENPPKTLEEWYTKATNFYIGHKRAQRLFKKQDKKPMNSFGTPSTQKKFTFPKKKDPNAMDIDWMMVDERTHLMKEGKCFKLFGHLSQNCPNKGQNATPTMTTLKWTGKSVASHIRALIASMSEEEKRALEEEGEKNGLGFWSGGLPRRQHFPYIFSLYMGPTIIILFTLMQLLRPLRKMNWSKHDLLLTLAQEEPSWTRTTWKQGFNLTKLEYLITAWNMDGTENKQGTIRYYTDLDFTCQRQETHGMIFYHWIGKPKSHFGITLVVKA